MIFYPQLTTLLSGEAILGAENNSGRVVGLAAPPQEPHPDLGLRPRFSVLRLSFGSPPQQSSFPPMLRGLNKTLTINAIKLLKSASKLANQLRYQLGLNLGLRLK